MREFKIIETTIPLGFSTKGEIGELNVRLTVLDSETAPVSQIEVETLDDAGPRWVDVSSRQAFRGNRVMPGWMEDDDDRLASVLERVVWNWTLSREGRETIKNSLSSGDPNAEHRLGSFELLGRR